MANKTIGQLAEELGETLTKAEEKAVIEARKLTAGIAVQYAGFRQKVSEIAPVVIGTYATMNAARGGKFALAAFARILDPTVPMNARENKDGAAGYLVHKTYMALDYMRRSIAPKRTAKNQGTYDGANKKLERMIASVLTLAVTTEEKDRVWSIITKEFGIQGAALATLQRRVKDTKPVIDLSPFAQKVDVLKAKPIHMEGADNNGRGANAGAPGDLVEDEALAVASAAGKGRKRKAA